MAEVQEYCIPKEKKLYNPNYEKFSDGLCNSRLPRLLNIPRTEKETNGFHKTRPSNKYSYSSDGGDRSSLEDRYKANWATAQQLQPPSG